MASLPHVTIGQSFGRGLFAALPIETGSVVLKETPLFSIPVPRDGAATGYCSGCLRAVPGAGSAGQPRSEMCACRAMLCDDLCMALHDPVCPERHPELGPVVALAMGERPPLLLALKALIVDGGASLGSLSGCGRLSGDLAPVDAAWKLLGRAGWPTTAPENPLRAALDVIETNTIAVEVPGVLLERVNWIDSLEDRGEKIAALQAMLPEIEQAIGPDEVAQALDDLADDETSGRDPVYGAAFSALPVVEGLAVFKVISGCLNHSCVPNCRVTYESDHRATLTAITDIEPGQELFISYVDEYAPLAERRENLAEYGFVCACPRCKAQEQGLEYESDDGWE